MFVPATVQVPFGTTGHRLSLASGALEQSTADPEVIAWITAGTHRRERVVISGMGCVPAVADAPDVEQLSPQAVFGADALRALLDAALHDGRAGLRLVLDVEAGLAVLDPPRYEAFELAVDRLCREQPLSVLCRYAADRTVGPVLPGAVTAHSAGVRHGRVRTALSPSGVLLVDGEVDAANSEAFGAAVAAAAARSGDGGEPELEVDLSSSSFVGSAAVRALLLGSRTHRDRGGRLVLTGATGSVDRVLRTCAIDQVPGVRLTEGAR